METKNMQFPSMTKEEYNDRIKMLNAQKKEAAAGLKKYRKSLTEVKYVISQLKMQKEQIIIREPKHLKGQKSLF